MSELARRGKLLLFSDDYKNQYDEGCDIEHVMLDIMLHVTSFLTNLAGCQ